MSDSEIGSGSSSSSEEDQDVEKVENNVRVPSDSTQEEESEESSQEEEIEEETEEVQQKKNVEQLTDLEKESFKADVVIKPKYKDIVLACFHHYPNEKISLKKIKSYARTEHEITQSQESFLKLALKKLINDEIIQSIKGKSYKCNIKLVLYKFVG